MLQANITLCGTSSYDPDGSPLAYSWSGLVVGTGATFDVYLFITRAGFYLYQSHGKTRLLVLSFGTFTHLICDQVWLSPQTLLWPIYGWTFQKCDLTYWLENILYALHTNSAVYVPELVGAVDINLVCAGIGAPEKGLCLYAKWASPMILQIYGRCDDSKDLNYQIIDILSP